MKLRKQFLLVPAVALVGAIGWSLPASADMVDDWLGHSLAGLEPAITYDGAPFELKFSHPAPPASIVPPVWQQTFDWLTEATNGKLAFKQFGGGTLVAVMNGFKGVGGGISDYGTCYTLFEGRGFEMSKVLAQPFLSTGNSLKDTRIFMELAEKYFVPEFERQEVNYGYSAFIGATDIMSKKPIRSLEDLKGLKVIAQGLPPNVAKAFGFVTLNIPFPEIYTSVQQGIADAVMWTDGGFVPFKIYELAKYHTTLGFYTGAIETCFNQKVFSDLPPDLQQTFYRFQQSAVAAVVQRTAIDFRKTAFDIYTANDVEFITLEPAELARWKEVGAAVVEAWAEEQESAGRPARALIADIQRLKQKYADQTSEEMLKIMLEDPIEGLVKF